MPFGKGNSERMRVALTPVEAIKEQFKTNEWYMRYIFQYYDILDGAYKHVEYNLLVVYLISSEHFIQIFRFNTFLFAILKK